MAQLTLWHDYSREQVHAIFASGTRFTAQRGTWGLHGIVQVPNRPGDFVFFVTLGKRERAHTFDEWVTEEGVLAWESQPRQSLRDSQIQQFIEHDELKNSIYLFLRTREGIPYTYLGRLSYVTHDPQRERPVHFQWQLLEWPPPRDLPPRIGLSLVPVSGPPATVEPPAPGIQELTEPPVRHPRLGTTTRDFRPRKGSVAASAAQKYGLPGEELVLVYERTRLSNAGRGDLAALVRHVAVEEGDGAGYDVLSYEEDGRQLFVEVKTTTGGKESMFFLTSNELAFAERHQDQFAIYRVYAYDPHKRRGSLFVLRGDPKAHVELTPSQFRATWT